MTSCRQTLRGVGAGICVVLLIALGAGCEGRGDYEGSFSGGVLSGGEDGCAGVENCSFIRRGFPEDTLLTLHDFVPPPVEGLEVGSLTTSPYSLFSSTPLRRIVPLDHDPLSQFSFPGAGRVRNYLFVSVPDGGPLAGRMLNVVVSLMDGDDLEVRVFAGTGEGELDHFGIFRLEKEP